MKTLMFVSAGVEAAPGIKIAKRMGLRVVASDANANAPGFSLADDRIIASTYDVDATVAAALEYNRTKHRIDGVTSVGCDVPLTVASIAKALGVMGISLESARLASDKLEMKRKFSADNVAIPWFSEVRDYRELQEIINSRKTAMVLKPADSRGSRGVLQLNEKSDFEWAFNCSLAFSPTKRVIVEEFLVGPQVSTESLVVNGVVHTPVMADRNYEYMQLYAPYIIENGGQLPSSLSREMQKSIDSLLGRAAASLGIVNGVIKGDIVVCNGMPYIIEIAARMSGGFLCTHEIPLSSGVEFVRHAIRLALGERPSSEDLKPRFEQGVAQRWIFPDPGKIIEIIGVDEAREMEGVAEIILRAKAGEIVTRPTDSNSAIGVIMAVGETSELAVQRAESAVRAIRVVTGKP